MDPEQFFFSDGRTATSLEQLHDVLVHSDESVTAPHITPEKNDYANWIYHVLGEEQLARQVQQAVNVEEAANIIEAYLAIKKEPEEPKEHFDAPKPPHFSGHHEAPPIGEPESFSHHEHHHQEHQAPHQSHEEHHHEHHSHEHHEPVQEKQQVVAGQFDTQPSHVPPHPIEQTGFPHRDFIAGLVAGLLLGIVLYVLWSAFL